MPYGYYFWTAPMDEWANGKPRAADYGVGRRQRAYSRAVRKAVSTWQEGYEDETVRNALSELALRKKGQYPDDIVTEIGPHTYSNSTLATELHDLALEIMEDIQEACAALDDPDIWYPGVDDGIEPVPDEHVELVIWGLQRELNRELRVYDTASGYAGKAPLPAVPLAELPWRVQRALAERRRLRYNQFGIGYDQWLSNKWSLWEVPEDPDWVPRRVIREGREPHS